MISKFIMSGRYLMQLCLLKSNKTGLILKDKVQTHCKGEWAAVWPGDARELHLCTYYRHHRNIAKKKTFTKSIKPFGLKKKGAVRKFCSDREQTQVIPSLFLPPLNLHTHNHTSDSHTLLCLCATAHSSWRSHRFTEPSTDQWFRQFSISGI